MIVVILTLVFLVLVALDTWTTRRVLALGGRKVNPVMHWAIGKLGRRWWIAKLTQAALGVFAASLLPGIFALVVLAALVALHGWAIWSNWRTVRQTPAVDAGASQRLGISSNNGAAGVD